MSAAYPAGMRLLGMVVIVQLAGVLAGCGDDEADPTGPVAEPFSLPVGAPSYDVDAATWAVRETIRVGEEEIVAEPAPDVYVVTGSGIYYIAKGRLYFTDGGAVEEVADVGSSALAVSPEGDHLALVDQGHGPVDTYGTHVAVPVVFDLETGEQVLRGEPGRSLEDDDLADLYGEIPPTLLGVDEEAVYAVDPLQEGSDSDQWRFPLSGGAPEPMTSEPMLGDETGFHGYAEQQSGGRFRWLPDYIDAEGVYSAVLSPAQDVMFVSEKPGRYYDAESGAPTVFSETPFTLGGWVDNDTFYGAFSAQGSSEGPSGRTTIASCDLGPQPVCTPLAPEFDLPQRPTLVFGTGSDPLL
jgi:hypothetical protein